MNITWVHNDYGRAGELAHLNKSRNDPTLNKRDRRRADVSHSAIREQMKDKKLMGLRSRLIKAAQDGNITEQDKIAKLMRDHNKEDQETGF